MHAHEPPSPTLDTALDRIVGSAVARGEVPGAVALTGSADTVGTPVAHGVVRAGGARVHAGTHFDLASLSKVLSTLPALLRLASDGLLDLDAPLKGPFPNAGWMRTPSLGERSARDLLAHASGLPAWAPLMGLVSTRRTAIGHALASELPHPRGEVVYSDLGFMVLGALVERLSGLRQDRFLRERIVEPLGIDAAELGYRPLGEAAGGAAMGETADLAGAPAATDAAAIAATEDCGWRGRLLQGEVHDEGAWIMGGVAGHAGLFGSAGAVARMAQAWLRRDARLADPALLAAATRRATFAGQPARGLGWVLAPDADEPTGTQAGWRGPRGYGHTGFTGTSVWIDPQADTFCVLLTNRVHPTRHGGHGIAALRREVHDAVFGPAGDAGGAAGVPDARAGDAEDAS